MSARVFGAEELIISAFLTAKPGRTIRSKSKTLEKRSPISIIKNSVSNNNHSKKARLEYQKYNIRENNF